MLCLNYLNKTVELLFILYNFAIVPSVGTGIKTWIAESQMLDETIVPSVGTGIKTWLLIAISRSNTIVPSVGTGIKIISGTGHGYVGMYRTLHGYGD